MPHHDFDQAQIQLPGSISPGTFVTRILDVIESNLLTFESSVIPAYLAAASAFFLSLRWAFYSQLRANPKSKPPQPSGENSEFEPMADNNHFTENINTRSPYDVTRIVGCSALCGLNIYTACSQRTWSQIYMPLIYFYIALLAFISTKTNVSGMSNVRNHLNLILVVTLSVYAYRDLYPLTTFELAPRDVAEGWALWVKIIVLVVVGVIIPISTPRRYRPIDSQGSTVEPNPEQTASIWSLVTFSFMDPIIFLASKKSHMVHDKLPPLADYDRSSHLKGRYFHSIDTSKKRHVFWNLFQTFHTEYITMAFLLVGQAISSFASPIGINRLLNYIETGGQESYIRPWFWVLWLLIGPFASSITLQWYIYLASRTIVQVEAILTQLIFEHSLRIRLKFETSDHGSLMGSSPRNGTSEHCQDVDVLEASEGSNTIIDQPSASTGARPSNLVGNINNLATTDMVNIREAKDFMSILIYIPLHILFATWFLYAILGWSAFIGLAVIVVLFPLPGYVAGRIQAVEVARMNLTDARIQLVTETMNVIRMIKFFGWENKMSKNIEEKRDEELIWIWRRQVLNLAKGLLNFVIPIVTMIVTYATYTLIMKQDLTASKVFSSMAVFDILRGQLHLFFHTVAQIITGKVSIDRVNAFLQKTELLDQYTEEKTFATTNYRSPTEDIIGIRGVTFTWSMGDGQHHDASQRQFFLHITDELRFKHGGLNLITGPTGCGKTSLLMALLGEMYCLPSSIDSWFNLPRRYGVAYAAQESWVINGTIKDNIIFGAPFDEQRYTKVIHQCCLDRDFSLFRAGDQTEVGERGVTLSGGQRARITLARAIYSQARTLLLDNVFAALDVHTTKWIVENCFSGDLIKGRTVLFVTHNVALMLPIADLVVTIGSDGRVSSTDIIFEESSLTSTLDHENQCDLKIQDISSVREEAELPGKSIDAEEIEVGSMGWGAFQLYFSGLGGNYPFFFFFTFTSGIVVSEFLFTGQTWYLGYWASQYENGSTDVVVLHYLKFYGVFLFFALTIFFATCVVYTFGTLRASRNIHKQLVTSILGTTLRWLDTTPTSRVVARCTQDIGAVDGPIAGMIQWLSELTTAMLVKLGAVVILTPIFLGPGIAVALVGGWCCRIYMAAQLSVKREMSNAREPILGHFGTTLSGLVSIRAYGAELTFIEESLRRIDRHTKAARTFFNLNRWITIRVDAIGAIFTASLAAYLVYFHNQSASNTGFSLNMAVAFSGMVLYWVQFLNDLEIQGISLERIQGYTKIEQEVKPTKSGVPPAHWPTSGELQVEALSASYSPDGEKVLDNISFFVKGGERVGIVGRTGSGKSSLTLSLLRSIFTQGSVYYSGLLTESINLESLRSNITIIPQMPEMLRGTVRQNLDPFGQFDDATLNDAMRAAGLVPSQTDNNENTITLDTAVSGSGGNFSVGQRQILALARAIVRRSKLLILDEATSAVDHKTDSAIQSSLRHELGRDVTVLIVAHRLQTIMDADKIMVLDAGRMVEFDHPRTLLSKSDSMFRALVEESNDKDILLAIASASRS